MGEQKSITVYLKQIGNYDNVVYGQPKQCMPYKRSNHTVSQGYEKRQSSAWENKHYVLSYENNYQQQFEQKTKPLCTHSASP